MRHDIALANASGAVPLRTKCGAGRNPAAEEEGGGDRDGRVRILDACVFYKFCCVAANLKPYRSGYNQASLKILLLFWQQ